MKMKKTIASIMAMTMALSAMSVTAFADDSVDGVGSTATTDGATVTGTIATPEVNYSNARTEVYDLTTPYSTINTKLTASFTNIALSQDTNSLGVCLGGVLPDLQEEWLYKVKRGGVIFADLAYDVTDMTITATFENGVKATYKVSSNTASEDYDIDFDNDWTDLSWSSLKNKMNGYYYVKKAGFDAAFSSFSDYDASLNYGGEKTATGMPGASSSAFAIKNLTVECNVQARSITDMNVKFRDTITDTEIDVSKAYKDALRDTSFTPSLKVLDRNGSEIGNGVYKYTISTKDNKKFVLKAAKVKGVKFDDASQKYVADGSDSAASTLVLDELSKYKAGAEVDMQNSILTNSIYRAWKASDKADDYEAFADAIDNELKTLLEVNDDKKYASEKEAEEALRAKMVDYANSAVYLSKIKTWRDADFIGLTKGSKVSDTTMVDNDTTVYTKESEETKVYIATNNGSATDAIEITDTLKESLNKAFTDSVYNNAIVKRTVQDVINQAGQNPVTVGDLKEALMNSVADNTNGETRGAFESEWLQGNSGTDVVVKLNGEIVANDTALVDPDDTHVYTAELASNATVEKRLSSPTVKVVKIFVGNDELQPGSDEYTEAAKKISAKASGSIDNVKAVAREQAATIFSITNAKVTTSNGQDTITTDKYVPAMNAKLTDLWESIGFYGVQKDKNVDNHEIYVDSNTKIKDAAGTKSTLKTLITALNSISKTTITEPEKLQKLVETNQAIADLVIPDPNLNGKVTSASNPGTTSKPIELMDKEWYSFTGAYDYRHSSYYLAEIVDTIGDARGAVVSIHVDPNSLKKNDSLLIASVSSYDARKFFSNALNGSMVLRANSASTNQFANVVKYDEATSTLSFFWDDITNAKFTDNVLYVRSLDFMSELELDIDSVQITIPDQAQFAASAPTVGGEATPTTSESIGDGPVDGEIKNGEGENNDNVVLQEPEEEDVPTEDTGVDIEGNDDTDNLDIFGDLPTAEEESVGPENTDALDPNDILGLGEDTSDLGSGTSPVSDVPVEVQTNPVSSPAPVDVTPTPVTPVTPVKSTPKTGNTAPIVSIPALLGVAAIIAKKKIK